MFDDLTKRLNGHLKTWAFEPLGSVSERHGSWEWSFHHKRAGLDRFVVIALTSLPEQIGASVRPYSLEVFAGADDGNRFVRRLVRESRFVDTGTVPPQFEEWLKDTVADAAGLADRLTPAELEDAYPGRRSGARS